MINKEPIDMMSEIPNEQINHTNLPLEFVCNLKKIEIRQKAGIQLNQL